MAIWYKDHIDYCPDCDSVGCQCIGGPETNLEDGIDWKARAEQAEAEVERLMDFFNYCEGLTMSCSDESIGEYLVAKVNEWKSQTGGGEDE